MEVKEEIKLFSRYYNRLSEDNNSVLAICSIHLAQQLEPYISRSLDLGWVIRCIMDINSSNLFSGARTDNLVNIDNSVHPEYKYAKFIIRLCNLLITINKDEILDDGDEILYELDEDSVFYFGQNLAGLNDELLRIAREDKDVAIS